MISGGCLCGAIRYEADGTPYNETLCHCSMCRRAAGAPAMAWATVKRADFRLTSGALAHYASSARAERGFCARCGTSLTFEAKDFPDEVDIATATLDDPDTLPPRDNIYASTRLRWMVGVDKLPTFAGSRRQG
jgi:hypothetical protein